MPKDEEIEAYDLGILDNITVLLQQACDKARELTQRVPMVAETRAILAGLKDLDQLLYNHIDGWPMEEDGCNHEWDIKVPYSGQFALKYCKHCGEAYIANNVENKGKAKVSIKWERMEEDGK